MHMNKPAGALFALLCVACLSATEADDLLSLNIVTDKITLASTDTAQLRITMANHSDDVVTLPQSSCGPYFFIRDSLARLFSPPRTDCSGPSLAVLTIEAHDSITVISRWAGEARTNTGDVDRLAPGTYGIYGLMNGSRRPIQSRSVSIKLLP